MKFHFANPGFLWLCLLVPPLLWWWLRQRRNALRHPATGLLAGLPTGRARWVRGTGAVLRGLALLLVVAALAGPRWPDLRTRLETEGVAIMMVLDVSETMGRDDFDWDGVPITRLEAAKRAFTLFVRGGPGEGGVEWEGRPTDPVGLVAFATRPEAVCPPLLSHSVVLQRMEEQKPMENSGERDTNITNGLIAGLTGLENTPARQRVLVLLSDGENYPANNYTGVTWKPEEVAAIAAKLKVRIYTLDADRRPETESTERREAVATMKELARATGGQYFQAGDTKGLLAAYQSIDQLEKTDIESYHYRRFHEAYPWLGSAAFVLVALALALEMTVWRRLP